jgi:hypothetical protein
MATTAVTSISPSNLLLYTLLEREGGGPSDVGENTSYIENNSKQLTSRLLKRDGCLSQEGWVAKSRGMGG